jgi:DNA-binding IclR family transcriptional regulator
MIQSVDRALAILDILRVGGRRLSDISRQLDVDKSTVSRMLSTLAARGFVRRDEGTGSFELGAQLAVLGQAFHQTFRPGREVGPLLDRISDLCKETVAFTFYEGGEAIYMDKRDGIHSLRTHSRIGYRAPMHAGASGKAILAFLPEAEADAIIRREPLRRFSDNTITDPDALKADLARIRKQGYVISVEEIDIGTMGIGVPLLNWDDYPVGSISVSGPCLRFDQSKRSATIALLRDAVKNWRSP